MQWRLRPGSVLSEAPTIALRTRGLRTTGAHEALAEKATQPTRATSSAPSRSAGQRQRQGKLPSRAQSSGPRRIAGPRSCKPPSQQQSKPEVRLARSRCAPAVQDAAVGSVTEGREAHLARHAGGLRTCPRCRWYKRGAEWVCSYGKFVRQHGRTRENVAWLVERPERFGGAWGLGCTVCAWFANRARSEVEGSCGPSTSQPQRGNASICRLGTRFGRFEVRPQFLQAEHVKQHAESTAHRTALIAWMNPDAPLRFASQASLGDELLLSGPVPQPRFLPGVDPRGHFAHASVRRSARIQDGNVPLRRASS